MENSFFPSAFTLKDPGLWSIEISPEIVSGSIIEKLPYKFIEEEGKYNVEYKLISIPSSLPLKLSSVKKLWKFNTKFVQIV